jgi:hypothetical protein
LHQEKSGNPDYIIFCFPGCPCIQEHWSCIFPASGGCFLVFFLIE